MFESNFCYIYKQEIDVLLPYPEARNTSFLLTCRLQDFEVSTLPLDPTDYDLVASWKDNFESLSSKFALHKADKISRHRNSNEN